MRLIFKKTLSTFRPYFNKMIEPTKFDQTSGKPREKTESTETFKWDFTVQSETLSPIFKQNALNFVNSLKKLPKNCACSPLCDEMPCSCTNKELPISTPFFNYKKINYLMENNLTFLDHENGVLYQETIEGGFPYYLVYQINHKQGDFEFDEMGKMHIFGKWMNNSCKCGSEQIDEMKKKKPSVPQEDSTTG
jgi:hypothetical protein